MADITPSRADGPKPGETLRTLRQVQDRIALGHETALEAQAGLLERFRMRLQARHFSPDDVETVSEIATLLLNGLDPESARRAFGSLDANPSINAFAEGALAYAEGRAGAAFEALERLDLANLGRLDHAQVLLLKGMMLASTEPNAARRQLGEARLLAPGTLIEEAALRREIPLHVDDPDRLIVLATSYLRRFGRSPFAAAFIAQLAQTVLALPAASQTRLYDQLDQLLRNVRGPEGAHFYADIARGSLVAGQPELAARAAERAMEAGDQRIDRNRARLYKAAAEVVAVDFDAAVATLAELQDERFAGEDAEILKAAISVAKELRRWPMPESGFAAPPVPRSEPEVETLPNDAENGLILRARTLLRETDPLLEDKP